jgi:hypothetical protein
MGVTGATSIASSDVGLWLLQRRLIILTSSAFADRLHFKIGAKIFANMTVESLFRAQKSEK